MSGASYRPEIDGLRAIAVIAVVIFHANLGLSGGYAGVDVFFVISGYLISGIIDRQQQAGTFSLSGFWQRRIRRLLPASTIMVLATLAAGAWLMLPADFSKLAECALWQLGFVSNVFLWLNGGYFAGPSEHQPLLHTWSLAIEEQFYIVFALFMVGLRRWPHMRLILLSTFTLLSLLISEYGVHYHPQVTFYMLPTRGWELGLGCLLALLPLPTLRSEPLRHIMAIMGLVLIGYSLFTFSKITPFPGLNALFPCLGTVCFLYAHQSGTTWPGQLLSRNPLVYLGRISYSWYLWHWPFLSLLYYWMGTEASLFARLYIVILSLVIAGFSYHFIEQPVRYLHWFQQPWRTFQLTLAIVLAISMPSLTTVLYGGFPGRFPPQVLAVQEQALLDKTDGYEAFTHRSASMYRLGTWNEQTETPVLLIWGDSHARALISSCHQIGLAHQIPIVMATRPRTLPIINVYSPRIEGPSERLAYTQDVLDYAVTHQIPYTLLVGRWVPAVDGCPVKNTDTLLVDDASQHLTRENSQLVFKRQLENTINQLQQAGSQVTILKQIPTQELNPLRVMQRSMIFQGTAPYGVCRQSHEANHKTVDAIFQSLQTETVHFIDISDHCFDAYGAMRLAQGDVVYYSDEHHLSIAGARQLAYPSLERFVGQLIESSLKSVNSSKAFLPPDAMTSKRSSN